MLTTSESAKMTMELLAKVEGLRSYLRRCRSYGAVNNEEFVYLMNPLNDALQWTTAIVHDRERAYQESGGIFAGIGRNQVFVRSE